MMSIRLKLGDIRVEEERTITGRVNNVDRQPVAGARVYLQPWQKGPVVAHAGGGTALFRMTYTDRAGRFRFDSAMHGSHLLAVNASNEGVHAMRITEVQGAKPIVVTMPKGGTVTGQALDEKGKPASFAEIQYILEYPPEAQSLGLSTCYLLFRTDRDGRFRIRGVPEPTNGTTYALFVQEGRGFRSLLTGTHTAPLEHRVKYYSSRR